MKKVSTLGELKQLGWQPRTVKDEIRSNLVNKLRSDETVFPGIHGYSETVEPQLVNALLAGHDMVMLGERGQAKTRLIRSLTNLLDEWLPIVEGSEIRDDPFNPVSAFARDLVAKAGDETPISWVGKAERFAEKLATPDTSIADLIGEVDPIKVAEGRYLSDEETLHFGLIPRANRGVFAINELPDLSERIQVGLLNVLEERDVQIRGFTVSLGLDLLVVASANPEDYTNRGRLITPLKDRFGSQIRTHYPLEIDLEAEIVRQEATLPDIDGVTIEVPRFVEDLVSRFSHEARSSSEVSQMSGVSVRLSVTNMEVLTANAARRAVRLGEEGACPRVCDLELIPASTMGKLEIDSFEEGRESKIVATLLARSVLGTYRQFVKPEGLTELVDEISDYGSIDVGSEVTLDDYAELMEKVGSLSQVVGSLAGSDPSLAIAASAIELVLEGLHLSKRLNKDQVGSGSVYFPKA